jgi:hypothetical protein
MEAAMDSQLLPREKPSLAPQRQSFDTADRMSVWDRPAIPLILAGAMLAAGLLPFLIGR